MCQRRISCLVVTFTMILTYTCTQAVATSVGDWTPLWTTSSLPTASGYVAATSLGSEAFFADSSGRVDMYDSQTMTWSSAILSGARGGLAAAAAGTKVCFGGGSTNVVDIYDTVSHTWSVAQLSVRREALSAVAVGSKILFAGGRIPGSDSVFYDTVDIYDAASGTWSVQHLSLARKNMGAATVGGKVYFGGGYGSGGIQSRVDIYDSNSNTWTTSALSTKREALGAVAVGTKVVFGGGGPNDTRVDILDTATGQWSQASFSSKHYYYGVAGVGTKAFFAGGAPGWYQYNGVDLVDVYDAASNTWTTAHLSEARGLWYGGTSVNNQAFFAGGSNRIDIYTLQRYQAIHSTSSFTLQDDTVVIGRTDLAPSASLNLGLFSLSAGSLSGGGSINLNGQAMTVGDDNSSTVFSGLVLGDGRFTKTGTGTLLLDTDQAFSGDLYLNGGTLEIGSCSLSAGTYVQQEGSTLQLGIYGRNPGDWSQLLTSGTVSFAGVLRVVLGNDFVPHIGDSFVLFTGGDILGAFSQLELPVLADGLSWDTSRLYSTGAVSIIPEPATLGLMAIGALAILRRKRA